MSHPVDVLTDDYFAMLNDILPKSGPWGCYALGMLTVRAVRSGKCPTRELMIAVSRCSSMEESEAVIDVWLGLKVN